MARQITVICDDDVEVMSITTRSNKKNSGAWVIGIFDVQGKDEVCMPEITDENEINKESEE